MGDFSKPRVAVVGCGAWGKNLVRNFSLLGSLAMVCDPSKDGLERARGIAPEVPLTEDAEKVIRSDVDGIVLATPAETHYHWAKKALLARKHVFVEKPLALNLAEGQELLFLAKEFGRILMVGHVLEYHPAILRLRELIVSGELGKIQYVYSNRVSLGKVRREENILWSFAPHDIAVLLRLVGALPFQVTASGGSYLQPNVADVTVTNLLFNNGVRGHVFVSWLHPFKEQRLVVVGSKKMASFDDVQKELLLYDQRVEIKDGEAVPLRGQGESILFAEDEPLACECQAFLTAIATGYPPITDGKSALEVLQVLDACQRSLITGGQPVLVPELAELGHRAVVSIN